MKKECLKNYGIRIKHLGRFGSYMRNIQLLDCTLRDGGYINDWDFGHNKIINIYERIISSHVDIIEVGFIDERRPFDVNRSIYPSTKSIKKTFECTENHSNMMVGMIEYGTCDIRSIQEQKDSVLDGIRVIFKKHLMEEAMAYISEIKRKGYFVFAQLVATSDYSDEDIMNLCNLANEEHPFAVSIVDTYGLLYPYSLLRYYELLDKNLSKDIKIGFHAHNNLQLAYANSISFLDRDTDRDIVIDGTLYGMGKSAGNTPIELLAQYLNDHFAKNYDISPLLECIEENIKDIYSYSPWGYRTQFYLSAENDCHPNYVSFLMAQENLSVSDINVILGRIENGSTRNKKLFFDRDYIERLYEEFLVESFDDTANLNCLFEAFNSRKLLIIGPGKNINLQRDKVDKFIEENNPILISINYIPKNLNIDYVFITKKSRYMEMTDRLYEVKKDRDIGIISISNVHTRENPNFTFSREPLLEKKEEILDNSFLMLLKILDRAGIKEVYCAGMDGYSDREDNYYSRDMEYSFVKSQANRLNHHIREVLSTEHKGMKVNFITYSHYIEVDE